MSECVGRWVGVCVCACVSVCVSVHVWNKGYYGACVVSVCENTGGNGNTQKHKHKGTFPAQLFGSICVIVYQTHTTA